MNADHLLALYERIADAPDAVARLRRFVLDLAVRGKLMPQDIEDEPTSEMLKRTKIDCTSTGPFKVPWSWRWVRVGSVSQARLGKMLDKSKNKGMLRPYLRNINVRWFDFDLSNVLEMPFEIIELQEFAIRTGDVLICEGGEPGRAAVWDERKQGVFFQKAIHRVRFSHFVDPHFFVKALKASANDGRLAESFTGTGIKHFTGRSLDTYLFPLPPLAEQHRIVAKVDELMCLCDRLEAVRASREAVRDRLAAASLPRLAAPDPQTLQTDNRFALDALPAITTRPDQIKALRQVILDLAVRGKLVPQDASDETSAELLARIVETRRSIVAKRNIRDEIKAKPSSNEMKDFGIPFTWEFCSLGQISLITDPNPSHRYPDYSGGTVPILSTREFAGDEGWNAETAKLTTQAFWEFQKQICDFAEGDIVFARKGRLGLPRFLPPFDRFTFSHTLFTIKPIAGLYPAYLLHLLRRDEVVTWLTNEMNQNTGVPTLGKAKIERLPISLPPLAEQHRIVAKVDALMSLCDRLEAALVAADTARARLLDALLAEALAPMADSSGETVAPTAAAALPGAAITTERSAFVLLLAHERHRSARRDRTFGHVKAEKILHLVEAEAGLDLGRAPFRDAAGPNDFRHLLGVDRWAKQHRRYAFDQKGKGYTFERLADFQVSLDMANTIDASTRARVEKIIDLFIPMDKEAAELFATLYAAWNNLLIEGQSPDDADILRAAREDWHPDKLKIPRDRFVAALRDLKASEFVPSGRGKFVPPAPQRDLFSRQ